MRRRLRLAETPRTHIGAVDAADTDSHCRSVSTLALVRHGQASAFSGDYDELSALGREQARALGTSWAQRKLVIDAIYHGPRRRHLQTFEHLEAAAAEAGLQLPESTLCEGFDEVQLSPIFSDAMKRVGPMCPDFMDQMRSGTLDDNAKAARKHFLGMVDNRLLRGARDEPTEGGVSFAAYSDRVRQGLTTVLREQGRGKRVAVFTSGGPIAVCMKLALQVGAAHCIGLMRQVDNASVSELLFTETDLSLSRFNCVGHLTLEQTTRI
jgi:broad specificity phosphatase PhoE